MRSILLTITTAALTLAGLAPLASTNTAAVIAALAPRQHAVPTAGFGLPRVPGLPHLPHMPRMP